MIGLSKMCIRDRYVPRKPNPTGLKNYVLAGKHGLILDFKIYQGETTNFPIEVESNLKLGFGGRAVLRLSETCPLGTNIYFDRFFTGSYTRKVERKRYFWNQKSNASKIPKCWIENRL